MTDLLRQEIAEWLHKQIVFNPDDRSFFLPAEAIERLLRATYQRGLENAQRNHSITTAICNVVREEKNREP